MWLEVGKWDSVDQIISPRFFFKKDPLGSLVMRHVVLPPPHMFFGEYSHKIDEKGRLAIPMKFRKSLGKGAVVTRGLDASLFLFPKEEWDKLAQRLARLPLGKAGSRALSRLMLAGAMEAELDKQGRLVLPDYLRNYASIKKEVVVAGQGGHHRIGEHRQQAHPRKDQSLPERCL